MAHIAPHLQQDGLSLLVPNAYSDTKNSQMAINRNSEEGSGVGSSRVSFLDRFQMEFSASSAPAKEGFSLKRRQNEKSRFERFKIIAEVETSVPSLRPLITIILDTKD